MIERKEIRRTMMFAVVATAAIAGGCSAWTTPETGQPSYIRRYVDAHYRELGDSFAKPLTREKFAGLLRSTRVLYIGDHHRDRELHHQIVDLIDWICDQGLRPVVGMEALGSQDNPGLQEYLSGGLDFEAFRMRVARRWPLSWLERDGIDREFYRHLLHQVRDRGLDSFPLEPTPRLPLAKRDARMATTIRRVVQLYPNRLILIVVGHAHIMGDGHLRGRVGAESIAIGARCSPALLPLLDDQLPLEPTSFLRTNRGVLFFPQVMATRLAN